MRSGETAPSWTRDPEAHHPHESHWLKLDASKAPGRYLDWQPVLPLRDALEWIVEWYAGFRPAAISSV